jgi:hypothetical protein
VGVGATLLYFVDPAERGIFPPCAFHLVTGWLCPGCGLTRAVHHLLHGDVATALAFNALLPLYLLLLGGLTAGWLWRDAKGYTPRALQVRASMVALAGVAMVGFGVLRNLA